MKDQKNSKSNVDRRDFLIGSALGLGGAMLPSAALANTVLRCNPSTGVISAALKGSAQELSAPTVVYIFLRGGMDGLSLAAPSKYKDSANYNLYKNARPTIGLNEGLQLGNSKLMLHPQLERLHTLYGQGKLAVIQGVGSPNNSRSHFDQMNYIESGVPLSTGSLSKEDGFFNRLLASAQADIPAASMQSVLPKNINGVNSAVALNGSLDQFVQMHTPGVAPGLSFRDRVVGLFNGLTDKTLCSSAASTSYAIQRAQAIVANASSWNGISPLATYSPAGVPKQLGTSLRQAARLLKGSPGTKVVSIDVNGWDTHHNMGVQDGTFAGLMAMLNHALATFQSDLNTLGLGNRVVTVVQTEFGRPLKQNGSSGLDHGRGSAMLVMGNKVKGGVFTRDWDLSRLEESRDVRVTIDYRDVLGQIVQGHMGGNLATAFPGYTLNKAGVVVI